MVMSIQAISKMITLKIDDQPVQVPEGTLIVDAAKKIGIDIPVFCYHPKMEPVGMCRMCLVDVGRPVIDRATGQPVLEADGSQKLQFGPKLETACTTPVMEGMVVIGMSDKVKAGRKDILEFLLTSHPLDCPICDKGGECPLQNLTMTHGPGSSRFDYDEKMHLSKMVPLGELIFLDRERCIQCARCVRFQSDIADDPVIGFYNRGRSLEIATFSDPGFDSYFSGNTTDICPVGALTTADFRFGARPWEMKATASVCSHCPVGCNITFNVRREAKSDGKVVIKRVVPRQHEAVNEIWMCDKGRFTYHFTENPDRLTGPWVRKDGKLIPASWDEALDLVAQRFREHDQQLFALASGRLSNEDLFNIQQLAAGLGGKSALYSDMAGGDLVSQVGVGKGTNFSDMGKGTAILVVASDLEEEAPIWWLRVKQAADRGATLIVANPRPTKTDRYASHILRYKYGQEAPTVLALLNALSAKRPDLPEGVSVSPELKAAAEVFATAENAIVIYGSEGLGLAGSQALAQACANLLIATNHVGRPNNGLLAAWQRANDQGAWELGYRPVEDLAGVIRQAQSLYFVAANPAGDSPELAAAIRESGAFVVVQDLFLNETAQLADVILPAQAFTEREGTFTSGERRVQRYFPAVIVNGDVRADFEIASQIGQRLGFDWESPAPAHVMAQMVAKVPAFAEIGPNPYRKLAETQEQWPIVGRSDLYYGGTTYENSQGLGFQFTPSAQKGSPPAMVWPQFPETVKVEEGLLAVPVTRLYDRGDTVLPSRLLHQRIGQPYVVVHPDEVARLHLRTAGGEAGQVLVSINGAEVLAELKTDEAVPAGIVLVPRSFGFPANAPAPVKLRLAERVSA
jgi:NADH-quinone oxidoreductase subunit G